VSRCFLRDRRSLVSASRPIRADEINAGESVLRTETRAITTDAVARKKFRRYWSFFSPGIIEIRWGAVMPVTREAEGRARDQKAAARPATS
jgi:hypothetical protein